ncbi:hypothetical protein TWF703_011081 [Orbilia oligospora]|uniref:Uncharacterized protein n=1 Tax=Orbilia oligospora TaxID=2813651 RepID=A0A7C8NFA6_ORBOL|nr:hypothetical protein TWF703_011081 [Orbilia oligospora]
MLDLVNRSCLITGGSKGIGLAIAARFARAGATCTLIARHERPLRDAISVLAESGQQDHRFLVGDVGDKGLWEQAIKMNEIDDVIRANLLGTIYGTKFYLKEMTRARRGCIINISSVLATTGGAGSSVYAASKSGLHGFVKSIAKEASRFNVRINNILPGYIETEMTADAAYYLATNDYVTGIDLIVDGGYAIR